MAKVIIQNSVICHKCNDEIWSANRHDFKTCSCGNISVDGGMDYIRRVGSALSDNSYTDISMSMEESSLKTCVDVVKENFVLSNRQITRELISQMLEENLVNISILDFHSPAYGDCMEAVKWGKDTGRNALGITLAVIRALNKNNLIEGA